jgi:glycosyltransferase involved in cell wall biosynthesis
LKNIIFVNSHPIQYFAPMYKYFNENNVPTSAWYCSDHSIKGGMDVEFGQKITWDIPLLEGYEYKFFKNTPIYEKSEFWRFVNWGMIVKLFKIEKSVIILHGYHYFTHFMIIMLGKLLGHTICLRNDIPYNHEILKQGWKQKIKHFGLRYILFPRINYFLFVGTQNRLYYESYNIQKSSLVSCPYAIDNDRFRNFVCDKEAFRKSLGIEPKDKVITFSAKYINKKRPLDLLKAFHEINEEKLWLIFVGDGELRQEMEQYITANKLEKVIMTGFVNQQEIPNYYAIAGLFVMCSSQGEHWGLSANEAMNFDLPMVLSDLTGCAADLVVPGSNGYVFETGNVAELTSRIKAVLIEDALSLNVTSKMIIDQFSYQTCLDNLVKLR